MRKTELAQGEHYHIYNRGNGSQPIFLDADDRKRFLFHLLYCQSDLAFTNPSFHAARFSKQLSVKLWPARDESFRETRHSELINFALMGNHFHLTVLEKGGGGISKYMQRVLNAYTKYFNTKYRRKGHLFEGPFHAVHVKDNTQLLHLSAYIHRNPRAIAEWRGREASYPWSSYQDYLGENRWGSFLRPEIITEQFGDTPEIRRKGYRKFVETSTAKKFEDTIGEHDFAE